MMKKLIVGFAVCVFINVIGMWAESSVYGVVKSPLDRNALSELVSHVMTDHEKTL